MYNGIGLQTPRGSGTSGHIQKNMSSLPRPKGTRYDFLKRLELLKDETTMQPRKANPYIVEHYRKRQILICGIELRRKLEKEGKPKEDIDQAVEKAQKLLTEKLKKGYFDDLAKDSHLLTQAKERQQYKMRYAFNVSKDYKSGSAFDSEEQQKKKLYRQAQWQQNLKYKCPHEYCGKAYQLEKELQRHLKYKHPDTYKKIEQERLDKIKKIYDYKKEREQQKNKTYKKEDKKYYKIYKKKDKKDEVRYKDRRYERVDQKRYGNKYQRRYDKKQDKKELKRSPSRSPKRSPRKSPRKASKNRSPKHSSKKSPPYKKSPQKNIEKHRRRSVSDSSESDSDSSDFSSDSSSNSRSRSRDIRRR